MRAKTRKTPVIALLVLIPKNEKANVNVANFNVHAKQSEKFKFFRFQPNQLIDVYATFNEENQGCSRFKQKFKKF